MSENDLLHDENGRLRLELENFRNQYNSILEV